MRAFGEKHGKPTAKQSAPAAQPGPIPNQSATASGSNIPPPPAKKVHEPPVPKATRPPIVNRPAMIGTTKHRMIGPTPAPIRPTPAPIGTSQRTAIGATPAPIRKNTAPISKTPAPIGKVAPVSNRRGANNRLRLPTDEMARLAVSDQAGPSTRRFSSIEDMDVDKEDEGRQKKRKRGDGEGYGTEEAQEDEEEEEEQTMIVNPKVDQDGAKRRAQAPRRHPIPINKYHVPRCDRCKKLSKPCRAKFNSKTCYHCAHDKVGCRGKGDLQDVPEVYGDKSVPRATKRPKMVDYATSKGKDKESAPTQSAPAQSATAQSAPAQSEAQPRPTKGKGRGKSWVPYVGPTLKLMSSLL